MTREILAQPRLVAEVLPRQNRGWQQVRIARPERPTWVEIDLEAIGNNVRRIAQIVGSNVQILAVLKADGYGQMCIRDRIKHAASVHPEPGSNPP